MERKWIALVGGVALTFFVSSALYAAQTYNLKAPAYQTQVTDDGFTQILMKDYYSYGVPGLPDVPSKIFRFIVPPDVAPESISVTYAVIATKELGKFDIKEIQPLVARIGNETISGLKADVYSNNAYYPENTIEYLGLSQMRKWRFVSVKYTPFQYNPVSKDLKFVSEVGVTITYNRMDSNSISDSELSDDAMDTRAREMFDNYQEGSEWYRPSGVSPRSSAIHNYVIITTNTIKSSSTKLNDFVTYLFSKGYTPIVVTESHYGGLTGQPPNGTAEKIRQLLINNYLTYGIKYVLLIGNPDPDDPNDSGDTVGDVPMKMCWPRRSLPDNNKESPTDYFYADLTGNWDLNGNGYFGEYDGDRGPGGVDFANEVYVARIPVYSGAGVMQLDSYLAKAINYGNATSTGWRKSTLLPMSFSDKSTDGAYLAEAMKTDYLTPNGYANYTLYMQGAYCLDANSIFSSDEELLDGATRMRWAGNPYGMVWWWGHGNQTGAYIGYEGCPPTGDPRILNSADAASLNDNFPSHVYMCSCSNGYPENPDHLGAAVLFNGGITTTSASRVSYYASQTAWSTSLKYKCDNASIGYFYGKELVDNNKRASVAFYDAKSDMGINSTVMWEGSSWANLFDFNLYGDPVATIGGAPSCPDLYTWNGSSYDKAGSIFKGTHSPLSEQHQKLRVKTAVAPMGNELVFKIKEIDGEESYINSVNIYCSLRWVTSDKPWLDKPWVKLQLISATHNTRGDVMASLKEKDEDRLYTVPGDEILLRYAYPGEVLGLENPQPDELEFRGWSSGYYLWQDGIWAQAWTLSSETVFGPGELVTFEATINNMTTQDLPEGAEVWFVLDDEAQTRIGPVSVSGLPPATPTQVSFAWQVPPSITPGTYAYGTKVYVGDTDITWDQGKPIDPDQAAQGQPADGEPVNVSGCSK